MRKKVLRIALRIFGAIVLLIIGWVVYVHLSYKKDFSATPLPDLKASKDPDVIARGQYVAHAVAHCSACHSPNEYASKNQLPEDPNQLQGGYILKAGPFGTFYPANLTSDNETGLGKMSDAQLARVIRHGVSPDGRLDPLMSFAVGPMADEDLIAVMSYVRSLPPIKNETKKDEWGFVAKALAGKFSPNMQVVQAKYTPPPAPGSPSAERGAYLAMGPALCRWCHSPFNIVEGNRVEGAIFSGGFEADPDDTDDNMEIMPPNLTSDPETGIINNFTTEEAFVDRFKKAGRAVVGSKMPWANFVKMTDDDLKSIYRFLKTVPPVKRATGPTRRAKGWKAK